MKNIDLVGLDTALREKNHPKAMDIQRSTTYETVKCALEAEVIYPFKIRPIPYQNARI